MRRLSVPACLVWIALAAACQGPGDEPATSLSTTEPTTTTVAVADPEPVHGLVATIGTSRLYDLRHAFGLGLRNVTDSPITVRRIQLDSPLYEPVPPAEEVVVLPGGGRRLIMPLPYGDAVCAAHLDDVFTAVVLLDNGEELRLEAREDDPGSIGRLHDRECAAADVLERVELRFGESWTTSGNNVSGELILEQRHPGPPVALEDMRGSVIFSMRFDRSATPFLEVNDDRRRASVPVTISATRCDPHALAESKRTFIFLTWATVGEADAVAVEVEPTGELRAALEAVLYTCS